MVNLTTQTTSNLIDIVDKSSIREEFAGYLSQMAETLAKSEVEGEQYSGRLGFEQDIANLNRVSEDLRQGVFRILILGDFSRGKTTILNALIGEPVSPTGIALTTDVIRLVRYGNSKQVIINYNDGKPPESIDFQTFKQRFTVSPDEVKKLESYAEQAFPDVDHVVIEYPLEILKNGIEFIDTSILNDTLGYINNCHAILFVLSGKAQFTMHERWHLEHSLKDKRLNIFFLINYWNYIRESLFDPDDEQEIAEAETKVRQHFKTNLLPYCQVNGKNLYNQRVFELNALAALRARVKNKSLAGTGFDKFIPALDTFLTEERIIVELLKVKTLARQTYKHVREAIETRISILNKILDELLAQKESQDIDIKTEVERLNALERNVFNQWNAIEDSYDKFLEETVSPQETDTKAEVNEQESFIDELDESTEIRQKIAEYLSQMAKSLAESEAEEGKTFGRLGLEENIAELNQVSENLRQGVFRILVFGDMMRGKTTLFNALIGEQVLPTGVNPCTAVITIVRYGNNKQVTIHFNDGKPSESIDFQTFNQPFSIPPDYEGIAFPDVERVVIEYPLEILKNGIEFIDFPGLCDPKPWLDLTLSYINKCDLILFVLSAKSQFTMSERRYLENYLKNKGLTIFFPINYWNFIRESLFDPDDEQEVAEAETKVRQHFKTNLLPYCQVNGKNLYNQRVFELNALEAFQARVKNKSLEGTGFEKFIPALNEFVTEQTNKRLKKEILTAKKVARNIYQDVHEVATQRSSLLREYLNKFEHKITRHIISNMGEIDSVSIKELEQDLAEKKAATQLELSNLEKLETNIFNQLNCIDTAYNQFINESYY